MGSIGDRGPVEGQFMQPLITKDTENSDPWQRNYYAPPQLDLVPKSYPLIDARPLITQPDYSPVEMLKSHGFAIVKHRSPFLDQLDGDLDENAVTGVYHPETIEMFKKVTGAKQVIVTASVFRQGKRAPEAYKAPLGFKDLSKAVDDDRRSAEGTRAEAQPRPHRLAGQADVKMAVPVRIPHMDYTVVGARQAIRGRADDLYDAAVQCGVIAAEDDICEKQSALAGTQEGAAILAEQYNKYGKPGPRYAAYSIWRPLRKVARDPLAISPNEVLPNPPDGLVYWPYENRLPGPNGDFLMQLAMLGVAASSSTSDAMKWYYLPGQEPDEVLYIKHFDSASLGADPPQAGAPWHASPEIGDAAESDEPRESIELRVVAFW